MAEKLLSSITLNQTYGGGFDANDVIAVYALVSGSVPNEEVFGFKVYLQNNTATSGSVLSALGDNGNYETPAPWYGTEGFPGDSYTPAINGALARITGGHTGTYCAEFTMVGTTSSPVITYQLPTPVPLSVGKTYIATCYVYMPSGNPLIDTSDVRFNIFGNRPLAQIYPTANRFDTSIYVIDSQSSHWVDLFDAQDQWVQVRTVFTVLKLSNYQPQLELRIIPFTGECINGGTLIFDDFFIVEDTGFTQSTSEIMTGPDLGALAIGQFSGVVQGAGGTVISNYKFCSDVNLNYFFGTLNNPAFPYMGLGIDQNSNVCQVAVEPCDIMIPSLSITQASNQFALDGGFTVNATSSKSAVRYSLVNDVYDSMTNTTGVFTGLGIGTYVVYARDAYNCLASVEIVVTAEVTNTPQPTATSQTYNPKYRLEFDDLINDVECRLDITERNFNGNVIDVCASGNPVNLELPGVNVNDKFDPLAPTFLTAGLNNEKDSNFIGLFTQDDRKYRVNFYNPVGTLKWRGYIIPSIFSEPYTRFHPYETLIKCTDGIADLSKKDFLDADGNKLSGLKTVVYIIALILKKLALDLQIRVAANLRENSGYLFIDTFHPMDAFYEDDGNPWNCERVVTAILKPVGAKLVQEDGYWNVVRIEEQTDVYDVNIYDVSGVFVSSSTYDPILEIKEVSFRQDAAFALHDHQLEIVPAYGKITILRNLYIKPNLIQSGGFEIEDWDGQNYKGWAVDLTEGSGVSYAAEKIVLRREVRVNQNVSVPRWRNPDNQVIPVSAVLGSYAFAISNITENRKLLLTSAPFPIEYNISDSFKFSFDYRIDLGAESTNRGTIKPLYVILKWRLLIGTYYYNEAVGWTEDAGYQWNYIYVNEFNKTVTVERSLRFRGNSNVITSQSQVSFQFFSSEYKDFETIAELTAIPTINLQIGSRVYGTGDDGFGDYDAWWELTGDSSNLQPDDYDGSTNDVAWLRLGYGFRGGLGYVLSIQPIEKIYLDNVDFDFYPASENPPESEETLLVNNKNYQESLPYEIETADLPENEIHSKKYIYRNFFYDQAGNPTDIWQRDGVNEELSLVKLLMKSLINQYRNPTFKLSGSFVGFSQVGFLTTLKHTIVSPTVSLVNEEFTGNINGWANVGAGDSWVYNANAARVTITGAGNTQILSQDVDLTGSQRISVGYDIIRSSSAGVRGDWLVAVLFSENQIVQEVVLQSMDTDGTWSGIVRFSVSQESDAIGFYVRNIEGAGTGIYDMSYFRVVGLTVVRYFTPGSLSKNILKSIYSGEWRQIIPVILSADPTIDDSGEGNTDTEGGQGTPQDNNADFSGDFNEDFGGDFDTIN
jgi:hypothetical protein